MRECGSGAAARCLCEIEGPEEAELFGEDSMGPETSSRHTDSGGGSDDDGDSEIARRLYHHGGGPVGPPDGPPAPERPVLLPHHITLPDYDNVDEVTVTIVKTKTVTKHMHIVGRCYNCLYPQIGTTVETTTETRSYKRRRNERRGDRGGNSGA